MTKEVLEARAKLLADALKQVEQQYLRITGQLDEVNFQLQELLKETAAEQSQKATAIEGEKDE